ncbi:helix-turn-helix domain-containing protein [Croceitalea marina]|uniref:Helix-turn-helix domain-containing protein n=1 Tax=Croceitalea marina TaxID=1775166 RepID=A0ABW5MW96_9FLAO
MTKKEHRLKKTWWWYILPFLVLILFLGIRYPYYEYHNIWAPFINLFYKLWFFCIIAASVHMIPIVKKFFNNSREIADEEIWLLNISVGVFLVYLAYDFGEYTSYIVGALTFSFVFYITILLWVFRRNKKAIAADLPIKYANSSISEAEASRLIEKLDTIMESEKLYLDPKLTLSKLSERLEVKRKSLSQSINQIKGYNYSKYIACLRVEEAKIMLASTDKNHHKISAIAYDSGFNSTSSFNASFKAFVGLTAKEYRESLN